MKITEELLKLKDEKNAILVCRTAPNVDESSVLGTKIPITAGIALIAHHLKNFAVISLCLIKKGIAVKITNSKNKGTAQRRKLGATPIVSSNVCTSANN